MNTYKKVLLLAGLLALTFTVKSQFTPVHVDNTDIYDFLEEMAADRLIKVNTSVKPWSREFICSQLVSLDSLRDELNDRQDAELDYFLRDYLKDAYARKVELKRDTLEESGIAGFGLHGEGWNPYPDYRWDLLYYQDSLFSFRVNPGIGGRVWMAKDRETVSHGWLRLDAEAAIGSHWAFYANIDDNVINRLPLEPDYFTQRFDQQNKFNESRGGVYYKWKWGSIGIVKDHFLWGTNHHGSNIFSARTPSPAQLAVKLKPARWIEFNFINAQLMSDMVDSTSSYYTYYPDGRKYRRVPIQKYLSANMLTLTPNDWLQFSFGNSVVFSDNYVWGFLVPVYVFKSIDVAFNNPFKTVLAEQNSHMFGDLVLRPIKGLQLNGSIFLDEFRFSNVLPADRHNIFSYKAGFMLSNLPLPNFQIFGEWTRSNPIAFQHHIEPTYFTNSSYNLGHYLRDNSREFYGKIRWKPTARLRLDLEAWFSQHGENFDYRYPEIQPRIWTLPILENIIWEQTTVQLTAAYKFLHSGHVFAELLYQNTTGDVYTYTPEFFWGKGLFFSIGTHFGL